MLTCSVVVATMSAQDEDKDESTRVAVHREHFVSKSLFPFLSI